VSAVWCICSAVCLQFTGWYELRDFGFVELVRFFGAPGCWSLKTV